MVLIEVLVLQYYNECKKYFGNKFNVRFLIGLILKKEKEIILKEFEYGFCKMVIGIYVFI